MVNNNSTREKCNEINERYVIFPYISMAYLLLSLMMLDSLCDRRVSWHSSSWWTHKPACPRNSHGVAHKRSLPQSVTPIPDLRSNLSVSAPGFTGIRTLHHQQQFHQTLSNAVLYTISIFIKYENSRSYEAPRRLECVHDFVFFVLFLSIFRVSPSTRLKGLQYQQ